MSLTGKKALVTGANGFLGAALVNRLISDGVAVRALVRNPEKATVLPAQADVQQGDITDPARMADVAQGCDVVFHVAAMLGGALNAQRRVNVEGARNVMHAAAEAGARVVHVSTISVYGYRSSGDVTEETTPAPHHEPYGVSKWEGEQVVQEVGTARAVPYAIIRPGMIYGPRSDLWSGQMFRLARRKPTVFIGNGSGSAYPIFVTDVVDMLVVLAHHEAAVNQTFHCTPDPSPTWRAFLGAYSHLAGHSRWFGLPPLLLRPLAFAAGVAGPVNSRLKDLPDLLPFSQRYITYKMDKARTLLNWQPRVALVEGVLKTEPWLREKGYLK